MDKKILKKLNDVLIDLYKHEHGFVFAWSYNPQKVFADVVRRMKVVPYDIKERLEETYKHNTTSEPDEDPTIS